MDLSLVREMLKRHEGLRLKPYICPAGKKTIGYGWNLDAHAMPDEMYSSLRVDGAITQEMADQLLTISIEAAEQQARGIWKGFDGFTDRRQSALVDLVFNMGAGKVMNGFPSFCKAVNAGDWKRAADELMYADGTKKDKFSGYWKQVGDRAVEIVDMICEG